MIQQYVPGTNGADAINAAGMEERRALVKAAGRHLAALHDVWTFDCCGTPTVADGALTAAGPGTWPEVVTDLLAPAVAGLEDTRFADVQDRVEAAVDRAVALLAPVDAPVLLKQDFSPGNTIVRDGGVVALVDWESAVVGPATYDVWTAEQRWVHGYSAGQDAARLAQAFREGYSSVRRLPVVSRDEATVYRFVKVVKQVWGFPWRMQGQSDAERDEREASLRERLDAVLAHIEA